MKIIIVGGGKLAYYLVKTLQPSRHKIVVIEQRKDLCEKIATELEVEVYNGDGTNISMLEQAGCMNADFMIAITGKDENNLIACEIGKKKFMIRQTVAKVNNPKNIDMFYRLGVDKPVSSTQILADLIEQEVEYVGMRTAYKISGSSKVIVEFALSEKSGACSKTLREYSFPGESKIVLITRKDGQIVIPKGDVFMKAEDHILLMCDEDHMDVIWRTMVKK
ncbi:MAG: potassium channel family protein [Saccharofermentanales bacterium]